MADKTLERAALVCPICLDLLKDPVTIPCGHSYCKACIDSNWKHHRGRYSCPECRKRFRSKPSLVKNIMLAGLVEQLKQTAPPAADSYAGPRDVPCDMCTGTRKMKAVRSCLQCLVSYCEIHLQPHSDLAVLKRHQLVAPCSNLQENICSEHNEVKKMFCRTDQILVCVVCCMDQHLHHVTVTASAEFEQRRGTLKERKDQLLKVVQAKENDMDRLLDKDKAIRKSAEDAVERMAESISNVIRSLVKKRSKMKRLVRLQQETELNLVQLQEDQLRGEVSKLKRSISELETLEMTTDPCHFLQHFPASSAPGSPHEHYFTCGPSQYGDFMASTVSKFTDSLKDTIKRFSPPEPEPTTRAGFLRCACDITLDPGTAHPWLSLCAENRGVTLRRPPTAPPDDPDRFNHYRQVLSREALSSRCYWEVEWSGEGGVRIALSYKDIQRQGNADTCAFGYNDRSWTLDTFNSSFSIWFNKEQLRLSGPLSRRVGVYLDHTAGLVSFYSISQTMSLLHRLHTSFTQPLHVGVWFYWGYSGDTVYFPCIKNNLTKLFLNCTNEDS